MQPSAFYVDEEKTYAGGFNYKVTTLSINALYHLNDTLDNSISYTTPKNSKLDSMEMGGWNNTSASAYVDKQLYFNKDFGSSGHSNINSLTVSKGSFAEAGKTTICFAANPGAGYYYFGNSAEGSETKGSLNCKLITDMEINKIVFRASIPTGWTKADFDAFESNGSLADNDGYEISFSDFMANPSNYYIRTFTIGALGYWDGSTWKANNLSNSPQIAPIFITNNAKTTGFLTFNKHHFDNAPGTGAYGISNVSVYNSSATNATNVNAWNRGAVVSGLSSTNGYILGNADTILLTPDLTGVECEDLTSQGVLGAGTTLPAKTLPFWDALKVFKYDQYTLTADSGSSGPSHFTRYNYYFCAGMKGDYFYKLLAYIGAYFYTGSLTDLNDSGATPDNMAVTGMKLGEMDGDGNTTGNWIGPDAMPAYTGPNKGGSIVHPGYNPSGGGGGGDDDIDSMGFDGMSCNVGGPAKYYIMSYSDIHHLIGDFNAHAEPGTSISNNIISCYVNALDWNWSTGSEPIEIYSGGAQTIAFTSDINYDVLTGYNARDIIGSIDVPRMTNTFYDFSPYSTYEVYIPFCGWVALPDTVAGRHIKIYFETDEATCGCKGRVFFVDSDGNGVTVAEITGSFGAPCPIQVIEGGLYKGAMLSNGLQVIGGIANGVMGGASGSGVLAVGGLSNAMQGLGNCLVAGNTNYGQTIGRAGDASGLMCAGKPYLKITYPPIDVVVNNSIFGHTIGYLCNEIGNLSNYHGFTVCGNPHINISATSSEKEEIKQLLEQGVILP